MSYFTENYQIRFNNLATSALRSELLRAQNLLRVKYNTGRLFPEIDPEKNEYFMLCLIDPWTQAWEIVKVIEKQHARDEAADAKDTFKIIRAQEGTKAQYFPAAIVR